MILQTVFDTVAKHLLTQNAKSLSDHETCVYRSKSGLKCAVGCLIADEYYHPELEGGSVYNLDVVVAVMATIDPLQTLPIVEREEIARLLRHLQKIHDSFEPETWPMHLVDLASKFKLTFRLYESKL